MKVWDILLKKFNSYNQVNNPVDSIELYPKTEYNSNNIYKLKRELDKKGKIKKPNKLAISFLFCSISFAALRDVYQDLENTYLQELPSQDCLEKLKVTDRILANCLIIPYYLLRRVINNRYHIPFEKITQLICYSDYGYRAASTKTSSNWLFCLKCYESGHVSLLENGTSLVCGGGRKKITRFDPKSIEKLIHNVINDL